MKAALQKKLALTPHLQQSIKLLQLSSNEIRQEIIKAIQLNPLLDYIEEPLTQSLETFNGVIEAKNDNSIDLDTENNMGELANDLSWDDLYPTANTPMDTESQTFEVQGAITTNLQDHLKWQINLSHLSETENMIAMAIIDSINDDGFLTTSLEEIKTSLGDNLEIDLDEIAMVLKFIQSLDPIGVGARNLKECLLLQLKPLPETIAYLAQTMAIVQNHLDLLAVHDYSQIMKLTKLREPQLAAVINLIKTLKPKPGSVIANENIESVIPDLIVAKHEGKWRVQFNPDALPQLQVNTSYAALIPKKNQADYEFLHHYLQEAKYFVKSIAHRNETLIRVTQAIIKHQMAFLEHGQEAMKPLTLQNIADELDLHESTISRVTTQKYILTPQGVFELKYFFSSHLNTNAGQDCSSIAIRAMIKKMIANEDQHKPLSDHKILQHLKKQGINIARRTISKYREEMGIPASFERKILISNKKI